MTMKKFLPNVALCSALLFGPALFAQTNQSVRPNLHPNLAAAQRSIGHAYQKITTAQGANRGYLGGHAKRAKELLQDAAQQLAMAASYADKHHR